MSIALAPKTQKLLEKRMKRGGYQSPDDTIRAALAYMEQQELAGEFEAGELEKLLAVADAEIERGELHDGETVFREIRALGKNGKKRSRK